MATATQIATAIKAPIIADLQMLPAKHMGVCLAIVSRQVRQISN
jgi:hypothetical protein